MIPKFRAWDERAGLTEVISIDLLEKKLKVSHWEYGVSNYFPLNDVELMQSTGLKDKNGVEIFEGDCFIKIFRTIEIPTGKNGIEKSVGIVKFHEGAFQVHIGGWGYKLLSEVVQPHIYGANDDYWENVVIGNIYENPELLEVEG